MDLSTITSTQTKELLDAQSQIWSQAFNFHNTMALKCCVELGIPDVIHKHGKPITLTELANALDIHPSKLPYLHRLMRLLCHSNLFTMKESSNGSEIEYNLTITSQLLVKDHPLTQAPLVLGIHPAKIHAGNYLGKWFKNGIDNIESSSSTIFHIAHGTSIWEYAGVEAEFNDNFNKALGCDSRFVASLLLANNEMSKGLFMGIESLVDVGGGDGTLAKAIAKAYPQIKCTVLDLPHVVDGLKEESLNNLVYVGGDMFEAIPPAQAVLLKSTLHDWSDEHCIKILKRCKEAIPRKDQGGKVIILDIVVKSPSTNDVEHPSTQLLFDMEMMSLTVGGKERTEEEWRKLFINAGFHDYKISPVLGFRSVIEVYYS